MEGNIRPQVLLLYNKDIKNKNRDSKQKFTSSDAQT